MTLVTSNYMEETAVSEAERSNSATFVKDEKERERSPASIHSLYKVTGEPLLSTTWFTITLTVVAELLTYVT